MKGAMLAGLMVCWQAACCLAEDSPLLAEIKSWDELEAVKPVRVAGEWDVRLGLADSSADAGPWKLLWCLAEYTGKEMPTLRGLPCGIDGSMQLGPVLVRISDPDHPDQAALGLEGELSVSRLLAAKKVLFAKTIVVAGKGRYRVDVFVHDGAAERVIAARTIKIGVPRICYWHEFGRGREEAREGEAKWTTLPNPLAARPSFGGFEPVYEFSRNEVLRAHGERPPRLPDLLPSDDRWSRLAVCEAVEAEKEGIVNFPLKLELRRETLTVHSSCEFVAWADQHFLARWWVKGEPVVPKADEEQELSISRELLREREMSVKFALPDTLGKIAVGDRVAIQLMYSPLPIERIYLERVQPNEIKALHDNVTEVTLPQLSNRLEFEVTAAMLKRE